MPSSRGSSWPRNLTWTWVLHCRRILYLLSHQGPQPTAEEPALGLGSLSWILSGVRQRQIKILGVGMDWQLLYSTHSTSEQPPRPKVLEWSAGVSVGGDKTWDLSHGVKSLLTSVKMLAFPLEEMGRHEKSLNRGTRSSLYYKRIPLAFVWRKDWQGDRD